MCEVGGSTAQFVPKHMQKTKFNSSVSTMTMLTTLEVVLFLADAWGTSGGIHI